MIGKKRYLITYDLNKEGQDYENVIAAIKSASDGNWCTYWKSSFLIRSDLQTADDVSIKITPYLDSNDALIVMEVTPNYQGWLSKKKWDYIRNHIFSDRD